MIRDLFPDVELLNSIPPDEVIPIGAAMQAGILVGKDSLALGEDSITVDCCASDITLKVGRYFMKLSALFNDYIGLLKA